MKPKARLPGSQAPRQPMALRAVQLLPGFRFVRLRRGSGLIQITRSERRPDRLMDPRFDGNTGNPCVKLGIFLEMFEL